jgi:hypothetical protein
MEEGKSTFIEYVTWDDGYKWKAELQEVTKSFPTGAIDPDFFHQRVSPPPDNDFSRGHWDRGIGYVTGDNTRWLSKCHSHSSPVFPEVSFSFEHFRAEQQEEADHEDQGIEFLDWDRSPWILSVDDMIVGDKPVKPVFNLKRKR